MFYFYIKKYIVLIFTFLWFNYELLINISSMSFIFIIFILIGLIFAFLIQLLAFDEFFKWLILIVFLNCFKFLHFYDLIELFINFFSVLFGLFLWF